MDGINLKIIRWVLVVSALILIFAIFSPIIFTSFSSGIDFTNTGEIGDTIGGIMNPFISIVAVSVTGLAFYMQYQANDIVRKQFKVQQFEKRFYEMLNKYEKKLADVELGKSQKRGIDAFIEFNENMNRLNYNDFFDSFTIRSSFKSFDRYFDYIFRIIKYVDNQTDLTDLDKKEYINSLNIQMSNDELKMLFYYLELDNRHKEYSNICLVKYGMLRYLPYTEMSRITNKNLNELVKNKLMGLVKEYKKLYKDETLFEIGDDVDDKFKSTFF